MAAGASLDWLYITLGWTLGFAAVLLLTWALFRDSGRTKRRCPKCWYDLSGTPGLICPECGRESRSERRLHKTRRRWRVAALGVLIGLIGFVTGSVPRYRTGGWVDFVPSSVLVFIAPAEPETVPGGTTPRASRRSVLLAPPAPVAATIGESLRNEAWKRLRMQRLARWQSQKFLGRYLANQKVDLFTQGRLPVKWPLHEPIPMLIQPGLVGPLCVLARGLDGKWLPSGSAIFDSQDAPTNELRVELGLGFDLKPLYRTARTLPIKIAGTRETVVDRLESAQDNDLARRILDPHLAMLGDTPVLILWDRSADGGEFSFGLPYLYDVSLDGVVLFSGRRWAPWGSQFLGDWEEVRIPESAWEAVLSKRAQIRVRGDTDHAREWYLACPFDKRLAACWAGEFSTPLEMRPHPKARMERDRLPQ